MSFSSFLPIAAVAVLVASANLTAARPEPRSRRSSQDDWQSNQRSFSSVSGSSSSSFVSSFTDSDGKTKTKVYVSGGDGRGGEPQVRTVTNDNGDEIVFISEPGKDGSHSKAYDFFSSSSSSSSSHPDDPGFHQRSGGGVVVTSGGRGFKSDEERLRFANRMKNFMRFDERDHPMDFVHRGLSSMFKTFDGMFGGFDGFRGPGGGGFAGPFRRR